MTVDVCLRGGRVFDVFSGAFRRLDVSIAAGRIVSLTQRAARETIDARRLWIVPGLVGAHVHLKSSHLSPAQFARAVVPRGTTTVIADPHEVANVCGLAGVRAGLASRPAGHSPPAAGRRRPRRRRPTRSHPSTVE